MIRTRGPTVAGVVAVGTLVAVEVGRLPKVGAIVEVGRLPEVGANVGVGALVGIGNVVGDGTLDTVGAKVGLGNCVGVGVGVDGLIGVAAGSTSSEPKKTTWV